MSNRKLEPIAQKVINQSGVPEENYGSVVLILMMISIIISAIRVIQECNKNKLITLDTNEKYHAYQVQIKELSSRRGWFTKMRLRKIIRRELKPEDYRLYHDSLTNAILDVAENLTEEELYTVMEAANV